jgi:hypothetical protein
VIYMTRKHSGTHVKGVGKENARTPQTFCKLKFCVQIQEELQSIQKLPVLTIDAPHLPTISFDCRSPICSKAACADASHLHPWRMSLIK